MMNNSKGSTLAIALSMVLLVGALGVGMIELNQGQNQDYFFQYRNTQALWLADAGLMATLNNNCVIPNPNKTTITSSGGTFQVTSIPQSNGTIIFNSKGIVTNIEPNSIRVLQATCTFLNEFQWAAFTKGTLLANSGITNAGTTNVTIDSVNNINNSTNDLIGTNAGTGSLTTTGVNAQPIQYNAGATLPEPAIPALLQSAPCPGSASGYANVNSNITTNKAGTTYYNCGYLVVSPGVTWTIDSPVVFFLSSGAGRTLGCAGEDLRSDTNCSTGNPANLGTIEINGPTEWYNTTTYAAGSYVSYGNQAWVSLLANNLNNVPSAGSTYWSEVTWNNSTSYSQGAYVTYNGQVFESLVNSNINNTPGSSVGFWADGSITIYAQGRITFGSVANNPTESQPSDVVLINNTLSAADFIIYSIDQTSQNAVDIYNTNSSGSAIPFYGLVYVPDGGVAVGTNQDITGSLIGDSLFINSNSTVNFDQSITSNTSVSSNQTNQLLRGQLSGWLEIGNM